MIPKIHAKGSSFKGIAAYVLHDKDRAKTSERVAWTETRNLATDNPHVAWKVMAATAMDQERLKEEAGVKKTGRKSFDAVLHFTLSWHPDEKENLTREEMMRAAHQAIHALGASDRQALVVHHSDEPQAHVHVIINRVSSDDGRMLSSSKEKLALSTWAQKYEEERGFTYCDQRRINNEARDRGEYTRGEKDQARNIYELEAANDNGGPSAKALREQQRAKDAALEQKAREEKERHRQHWDKLQADHKEQVKAIKDEARFDAEAQRNAVRQNYKQRWTMLYHENEAQMRDFERREKTFLGRFKNVLGVVDLQAIIRGKLDENDRTRRQALTEPFKALSDAGVRAQAIKRQQEAARRDLARRQRLEEEQAARKVIETRNAELQKKRLEFEKARSDLILKQNLEGAKLRAMRMVRNQQRERAWDDFRSGKTPLARPEDAPQISHAPDRFDRLDSIRSRFDRSAEDRFERKPDRDRD